MVAKKEKGCVWSGRKRKKSSQNKQPTKKFRDEDRQSLAVSDQGSWFRQAECWPEINSREAESKSPRSASGKKFLNISPAESRESGETQFVDLLGSTTVTEDLDDEDNMAGPSQSQGAEILPSHLQIVDPQLLSEALQDAALCRDCKKGSLKLLERTKSRNGLATKWLLKCNNSSCRSHKYPTTFNTSLKNGKLFEINRVAVLAFRAIGRGRSAAEKFSSILNISRPVHRTPWAGHTRVLDVAATTVLRSELNNAALLAKKALVRVGDIDPCTDAELEQKVCDTGVTIDGSWSSRGWCARDGVVAVISILTGQVVDIVYLTSSCTPCTMMEQKRKTEEITKMEYLKWYIDHEENCYLNHNGSASAMEAVGALRLYERSLEERKLRYIPFVGDGDSKSYTTVEKAKPYGPSVFIPKEECVNHVTKRMGTNLRSLVNKYKGKKVGNRTGIGGRGRLTIDRMAALTNFYGKALRDNKGDAEKMGKATLAILKHYSSTQEKPMHGDCPKGKTSWCSYQAALVCPKRKHIPIQDPFSPELYEVLEPTFKKLGSPQFLAACENCLTQNANECLHHVIWGLAPKEQFTSQQETHLAVCLGVMLFNRGMQHTYNKLLSEVGLTVSDSMYDALGRIDKERVRSAEYKAMTEVQAHRKQMKKLKSNKQAGFRHVEGDQYKSQGFYEQVSTETAKQPSAKPGKRKPNAVGRRGKAQGSAAPKAKRNSK